MILDPVKLLSTRFRVKSWILFGVVSVYVVISLLFYFQWVGPSLNGSLDSHIAADSSTYLYFADSLREGRPDPIVIARLSSFPNTLWFPVVLALLLKSTFAMVIANYAMFFIALILLKKAFTFSLGGFIGLLLLNATTTISLLSVNKEIVDLLVVSIFLLGYRQRRFNVLALALVLALLNRFEVCLVMLIFLAAESGLNPLRRRRGLTLVILTIGLSVTLPLVASASLADRFTEASAGGVVAWLDSLEMHYLFAVSVVPKIAETFFGMLVNASNWDKLSDLSDIANSYILLSNNLATAAVLMILARRRGSALRSDILYFAFFGCIIMSVSLVIQPRYFYFAYVLMCLEAAHPVNGRVFTSASLDSALGNAHA